MDQGIFSQIELLSRHKNIDPDIVREAVMDAILAAARKHYKSEDEEYKSDEDLVAEINPKTGNVEVFAVMTVANLVANPATEVSLHAARRLDPAAKVGSQIRVRKPTKPLGRIAAQMAKQVILQKIREAERETICQEFETRVNTMEYCVIKRIEGPELIVELQGAEARVPRREQSRLEAFMPGDRVRVIIKSVDKAARGPAVVASRASEELVKRLFEQEVPEIYDNTVEIKACAREAGERTKIAVLSRDRDVDAVGACVGAKGMRVQTIIRELRGEKIDIIEYMDDPVDMVCRAISPAKVNRVNVIDARNQRMEVVVDESQLSLAIGKKGQNVRLAVKLLGWRIDIKSEEDKRREVEEAMAAISGDGTPVSMLLQYGLSQGLIDRLAESGVSTVEALADMTPEQLEEIPSVGPELIERIERAIRQCYEHLARTVGVVPAEDEGSDAPDSVDESDGTKKKPVAAAPVLPGAPVSGAVEEDDEEIDFDIEELEGLGKMNRYRGPIEDEGSLQPGREGLEPSGGGLSQDAEPVAVALVGTGEPSQEE